MRTPSLATLALVVGLAPAVAAAPYPTNTCVGSKQQQAGKYCKSVLRAWSRWNTTQNGPARDSALQSAAGKLDLKWTQAETRSSTAGVDCADTTTTRAGAQGVVDAGVADIVAAINAGLDLGTPSEALCGAKLLRAAATKCAASMKANAKHVKNLARDPDRSRLATALANASTKFSQTWASASSGCPTTATEAGVEALVDGIRDAVVRDTTISPNVDDTQFTTYLPTGPIAYQGRDLTPICMNGTPYAYFAKRGSVNKLLVYYQGGGACWEQLTCSVPVCDTSVNPAGGDNPNNQTSGFADRTNPANPFRDWNIVFVPYCSCDVHFGDSAQDYPLHVEHRGYQNSKVVEKFAREHFVDPEQVFVTGSSAGAYGAWFNAPTLHDVWPASSFQVLADAGNGVITADFLQNFFPNWNFEANLPSNIPGVLEAIQNGTGIPAYTEAVADFFPATRWAHYTTAYDGGAGGQTGFYNLMLNGNNPAAALTWWNGSCAFNTQMRTQALATAAAVPSNYRYYIGTGSRHTMWGSNKVYTDTTGGVPTIVDWLNAMLDGTPGWTNVECTNCGLLLTGDPRPAPLVPPFEASGPDVVVNCGP